MTLINRQVEHKAFGKGNVVEQSGSSIEVHFQAGNKKFIYPEAFSKFLTLTDPNTAASVQSLILQNKEDSRQESLDHEKERVLRRQRHQLIMQRTGLMKKTKLHPSAQAAFQCEPSEREEIFTEWRVFTGVVKNGRGEGQSKQPTRLHQNSACLLTAKDPDMSEADRYILGVYMVGETFTGMLCTDGYVTAHSTHRLQLSEQDSKEMLFWNYYVNEKYPSHMTWNTGKYRYFDNLWMARILQDIVSLKTDPEEQKQAQSFLDYYCEINRIDKKQIPEANGALARI